MKSLLQKKIRDLTAEDLSSLFKPIGTIDIPYPGAVHSSDQEGIQIGMVAGAGNAIPVLSTRPHEHVVGLMYCNMATFCALDAEREILEQMRPESDAILLLVLGEPGWGKTQLAENTALMMDDRGYHFMNCAQRDLEEVIWETAIDPGEDYKSAIRSRIKDGSLLIGSLAVLEEELPEALIRDEKNAIIDIDWDKGAAPRAEENEASRQGMERNTKVARIVAEHEGIPEQSSNIIGFRKMPGLLKKAWDDGTILILDEFTKGENEEQLLELLQWAVGMGKDDVTIRATMSINGRDETSKYTLRRSERKAGFKIIASGNMADAMLRRVESAPLWSRIKKIVLNDPIKIDWAHRAAQILTGAPVPTLAAFFSSMAEEDPENFADTLLEWRRAKAQAEGKEVPLGHVFRLKNWQNTQQAVNSIADGFYFVSRLMDLKSDLYDASNKQNEDRIDNVMPEITPKFTAFNPIDPRIFVRLVQQAEQARERAQRIDPRTGKVPRFNRNAVGKTMMPEAENPILHQAEFGTYLRAEIEKWVAELTIGRPAMREEIEREFRERGIAFTVPDQDVTMEKLLNQDIFTDLGGVDNVVAMRAAIAARMRKTSPDLQDKPDGEIVPLEQAADMCREFERMKSGFIALGDGLSTIFNGVNAVDGLSAKKKPEPDQLILAADFLETLKIPEIARHNMQGIMQEMDPDKMLGIATLMMRNDDGKSVPMHVLVDRENEKSLIVADGADDEIRAALGDDCTMVDYDDSDAEDQINAFLYRALKPLAKGLRGRVELEITNAFTARAGVQKDENREPLAYMMTTRDWPMAAPVYMVSEPE
jgi:hypothetical protein